MRDSGVGWIGPVPQPWDVGNLRRYAQMKTGHTPSRSVPGYWENCTIPWFTLADVWQLRDGTQTFLGETKSMISDAGLKHSSAELLPGGTVVLSRTASVGFSGIMPSPMATSQDFWNWICGERLLPEYLVYVFRAMRQEFRAMTAGSTHQTIYQHVAAGIEIPLPPLHEQRQIVGYLDRETAKIDALVCKQEQLIETLRKRGAAIVDGALSRGLDPHFPAVETGNPWLPRLPANWESVSTRRILAFGPANGASPETGGAGDLKSLSLSAVRGGRVSRDDTVTKFVNRVDVADVDGLRLRPEDILLVRGNGNLDLVARAGLVGPEFADDEYIYPDLLIRLRTTPAMSPEFFVWAYNSTATRDQVRAQARTTVGTFKVAGGDVRSFVIPLPPVDEQRQIVRYLDAQTSKIEKLIEKTERFVALSRERRSALISAAVTGQIDVRGEVAHDAMAFAGEGVA